MFFDKILESTGGGAALPPDAVGYLQNDGAGGLSWDAAATPQASGSDKQVQFNDGGTLIGAHSGLTYDKTLSLLSTTNQAVGNRIYIGDGANPYDAFLYIEGVRESAGADCRALNMQSIGLKVESGGDGTGTYSYGIIVNIALTADSATKLAAIYGAEIRASSYHATEKQDLLVGVLGTTTVWDAGGATTCMGVAGSVGSASGTIDSGYNFYAYNGSGPVTNLYGLYVEELTAGTNNYGLYVLGAAVQNVLAGTLSVGSMVSPLNLSRTANDALGFEVNVMQSRGAAGQDADQLCRQNFYGYNDGANNGGVPQSVLYAYIEAGIAASGAADDLERGYFSIWAKANYDDTLGAVPVFKIHQNMNYFISYDFQGSLGTLGSKGPAVRLLAPANSGSTFVMDSNGGDSTMYWTAGGAATEWFTAQFHYTTANLTLNNSGNGTGAGVLMMFDDQTGNINFYRAHDSTQPTSGVRNLVIGNTATAPSAVLADSVVAWCADYAAGDARLYLMGEKNTNTIALGAGNIHFDPRNMADDSVSGKTFTGQAGENLVWGDVVYLKSDGKFWKADFNATTTTPAVAFCTGTIAADGYGEFLEDGWVRDDSGFNFTFGAQTGTIYLGEAGAITQTAPSGSGDQVQVLGWALEADIFYFRPQLVMVEV